MNRADVYAHSGRPRHGHTSDERCSAADHLIKFKLRWLCDDFPDNPTMFPLSKPPPPRHRTHVSLCRGCGTRTRLTQENQAAERARQ